MTVVNDVYVIGAAMSRFGKFPDATIRSLAEEVVRGALSDATLEPEDVDIAFFSNAVAGLLTGQEMIRGQVALRNTGLLGIPIVNVENACASASSAFYLATLAVGAGEAEVAIAVGSEKLTHTDKRKSFAAIGSATDLFQHAEQGTAVGGDGDHSPFMDIYAARACRYMEETGATQEDFAQVAVKSHRHAALNPKAQYRDLVTADAVLASRRIAWPLTLLMCSPIGDGAAAIVVCSAERARSLAVEPVRVNASVLVSGMERTRDEPGAARRAIAMAYERASFGPEDLDVIELHDAVAPAELMKYEDLQLCVVGEGPELLRSGSTALGGQIPVNTSGGLLSKGHPIGATGCAQLVELVEQLRGRCGDRQVEGARVGLAENGGGSLGSDAAAAAVTILSR